MFDTGEDTVSMAPSNIVAFAFSGVERFDTQLVTSTGLFIDAEEFEDDSVVHLEGFNTLNYQMPQFLGDNFTLTGQNGSNLVAPPTAGGTDMTLDGTAGPTALSPTNRCDKCRVYRYRNM